MRVFGYLKKITAVLAGLVLFLSSASGQGLSVISGLAPLPAYADDRREGDIVYLDSDIRDVSDETVNEWAEEAGLIEEWVDSVSICTKMDLVRILWIRNCRPEYKADALNTKFADVKKEDIYPALWAYKKGVCAVDAEKKFKPDTELTHGDVLQTLWFVKGRPAVTEEVSGFENLNSASTYYDAVLWAGEQKLLIKDEKTNFDGNEKCTLIDALRYVYYQYHVRSTFPITRKQFIEACDQVAIQARLGGYQYGDSNSAVPTADGIISCDRIVAKALWDLGYTDQTPGGFANGNEDMYGYLISHGFTYSQNLGDIGYGSIVCTSWGTYGHTFVVVSWDSSTGELVRYDMGSQAKIDSVQPFTDGWAGNDFVCVFNIPDE